MWLASNRDPWDRCDPKQVNAGLGYTRGAPLAVLLNDTSESGLKARNDWLSRLTRCQEPMRYAEAFTRWRESLRSPHVRCFSMKALGRVLVGHGTSAATGVGLTLHQTWGVPLLPGSAIKGVTAHHVETVYGDEVEDPISERAPFRGLTWKGPRVVGGPGSLYRRLFGAPDVEDSEERAVQGEVLFHDALWIPASQGGSQTMLARDVLTVHQRRYYAEGGKKGSEAWPVDFDDPNPVSFLTVVPGGRFLVALEARGAPALLERAESYVKEALAEWGVGGKTAAGHGRFVAEVSRVQTRTLEELRGWFVERKGRGVAQREQFQALEREWTERLQDLDAEERRGAGHLIKQYLKIKRGEEQPRFVELLARLGA